MDDKPFKDLVRVTQNALYGSTEVYTLDCTRDSYLIQGIVSSERAINPCKVHIVLKVQEAS